MIENDPNYAQMLYQQFMGMSPGNLAQTAQGVANGSQPPPTIAPPQQGAQLSPNMQLYLQNLSKPSPYTQGLKPLPEYVAPPEFDASSIYDDLIKKYTDYERANFTGHVASSPANMLDQNLALDQDAKLDLLTAWMEGNKRDSWLPQRQYEYDLLSKGLAGVDKARTKWEKENKQKSPMAQIYANPLW